MVTADVRKHQEVFSDPEGMSLRHRYFAKHIYHRSGFTKVVNDNGLLAVQHWAGPARSFHFGNFLPWS